MDDIGKGEKYLGNWSDNKKHGCGLIVTLDGIYYEGLFMQDVLTVSIANAKCMQRNLCALLLYLCIQRS